MSLNSSTCLLYTSCTGHEIAAIGLGVPGVVKDGVVTSIPNIPSWEGVDVAHVLSLIHI